MGGTDHSSVGPFWRIGCNARSAGNQSVFGRCPMQNRIALAAVTVAGLLLSGCATKGWVREMMGKQTVDTDAKLDRHAVDTDAKIGDQKIRVEGMGFRMARIEEQTTKIGERAEAAHVRVDAVDQRLTRLWTNRNVRQHV